MQVNTGEINTHKYNHVGQLPLCISLLRFSFIFHCCCSYTRVTLLYKMNNQGKFIALSFVFFFYSDLRLFTFSFFLTCMPYALQQLVFRPRCRFEKAVNLSENNLPPCLEQYFSTLFNNHVLCVKWYSQLLQDDERTLLRSS